MTRRPPPHTPRQPLERAAATRLLRPPHAILQRVDLELPRREERLQVKFSIVSEGLVGRLRRDLARVEELGALGRESSIAGALAAAVGLAFRRALRPDYRFGRHAAVMCGKTKWCSRRKPGNKFLSGTMLEAYLVLFRFTSSNLKKSSFEPNFGESFGGATVQAVLDQIPKQIAPCTNVQSIVRPQCNNTEFTVPIQRSNCDSWI